MANWTRNEPQNSSRRKKWNLDNKQSLDNLKYQIAEDGCSQVQYDLATKLLAENSDGDNESKGVHWLTRAAKEGHEGALTLLQECFRTRRGISASNEYEVQACLSMSRAERAARKAAREVFLCLSKGEEFITAAQLESKMREIYRIQKNRRRRGAPENLENGISASPQLYRRRVLSGDEEVFTEANLISAAGQYSHGHLPNLNRVITISEPHPHSLDHVPLLYRPIVHPFLFWTLLYHRLIKMLASLPDCDYSVKIPALLIVYLTFSSDSTNLAMFLPTAAYYLSILFLIVSTCKILKSKHNYVDFRIWSGLFLRYGDESLDTESTEAQFLKNNLKPFMYFFAALITNLMLTPIVSDQWILHSEMTVIAFVLVFITLFAFMYSTSSFMPDYLILISFGVNVLAKYPYEMDSVVNQGWRFLDLQVPSFQSFVIGNGIEFCLNCRALLYLIIPVLMVQIAARENWRGIYKFLIPHCVTLSWLQICISSSQFSTMFGLVRATLGLAGIFLFLPLFGIATLLLPVFTVVDSFITTTPTIKLSVIALVAIVILIGCSFLATNPTTQKYLTFFQFSICIAVIAIQISPMLSSNIGVPRNEDSLFNPLVENLAPIESSHDFSDRSYGMSWEVFYRYCQNPSWEHVSKVNSRIRCNALNGVTVKWDGTVREVDLSRISNSKETLLKYVKPKFLRDMLVCYFGEETTVKCGSNEDCEDMKDFIENNAKCHLGKFNTYDYQITVRMSSGVFKAPTEIALVAEHEFGNFTMRLNQSDRVWFVGELNMLRETDKGSAQNPGVRIDLKAMGCLSCSDKELTFVKVSGSDYRWETFGQSFIKCCKYVLNIIFNPLLTFK
ncbi:wolframin [Phlebotomus argentipes]|uniref:wolframin n=1 Tax=Phlebotomus argentipes TaxID=94469 RepID=UPI002893027C|nr:wolframin [Phlebotomus argentipes]